MALSLGIVGLPNSGKSTLFNALTAKNVPAECYPFCTVDPHTGIVEVPDSRLELVAKAAECEKMVLPTVTFIDIAGLVKGASRGEGLGNRFLGHIRETDALLHVVRLFRRGDVGHVEGEINPERDIGILDLELAMADISTVEKALESAVRDARTGADSAKRRVARLNRIKGLLETGKPLRDEGLSDEEMTESASLNLLTIKPVIYALNINEEDSEKDIRDSALIEELRASGKALNVPALFENELRCLDEAEACEMRSAYGIERNSIDELIRLSYGVLGLITFFSTKSNECRGWTIPKNSKASLAAGKIHTDMEKGFVKAEVIAFDDLMKEQSLNSARELGKIRMEGKDYLIRDGDVVTFRFTK